VCRATLQSERAHVDGTVGRGRESVTNADAIWNTCFTPVLAAYLSAHKTMINGSALCAGLAVTERD
jgi:hypothetical protein